MFQSLSFIVDLVIRSFHSAAEHALLSLAVLRSQVRSCRRVYITYASFRKLCPTPGCLACDNDKSKRNKECIARFDCEPSKLLQRMAPQSLLFAGVRNLVHLFSSRSCPTRCLASLECARYRELGSSLCHVIRLIFPTQGSLISLSARLRLFRGMVLGYKSLWVRALGSSAFFPWFLVLQVASAVLMNGGEVSVDWPQDSSCRPFPEVEAFEYQFSLKKVSFRGCALGMIILTGVPIDAPWQVTSSSKRAIDNFRPFNVKHNKASSLRSKVAPYPEALHFAQGLRCCLCLSLHLLMYFTPLPCRAFSLTSAPSREGFQAFCAA